MGDLDPLVDRIIATAALLARKGAMITWRVAFAAAVVVGGAYAVGLAALGGGARAFWTTAGLVLVVVAVGAPLLAGFRLRAIPRKADALRRELRSLLAGESEARRVVIDVMEAEPPGPGPGTPVLFGEYQRFATLRTVAGPERTTLADVVRSIAWLPALLAISLLLILVSAFIGFVFLLIWIF